jgi:hypothetical protein
MNGREHWLPDRQIERWWVCFSDGDKSVRAWWKPFTKPGFRHCCAFRSIGDDAVLFLNPLLHRVEQGVRFEPPHEVIRQIVNLGFRVCVVERAVSEYDPARDRQVARGAFVTCASVIAYTIGLDFRGKWTPWQLWQAVIAAGGEEIWARR